MKRVALIIALAVISWVRGTAQQSHIKIASDITMLCNCDQVVEGDTMKYKYSITNIGNAAMTVPYVYWNGNGYTLVGTMDHKIKVTNDAFPGLPVNYSWINDNEAKVSMSIFDPISKLELNHILPGDTAVVYVEDIVSTSLRHKEGNNTIVVWPENYDGLTQKDSLEYVVEVVTSQASTNGINNPWYSSTSIYPNPANDRVNISVPEEMKSLIEGISIRNIHGQIVKQYDGSYFELIMEGLADGHYTVSFQLNNSTTFAKPLLIRNK